MYLGLFSFVLSNVEEPDGGNAPTVTAAGSQLSEEKLVGATPSLGEQGKHMPITRIT